MDHPAFQGAPASEPLSSCPLTSLPKFTRLHFSQFFSTSEVETNANGIDYAVYRLIYNRIIKLQLQFLFDFFLNIFIF